jgi:hypothetical protein
MMSIHLSCGVVPLQGSFELWLNNKKLTSVPSGVLNLTGLTKLELDNNELRSLPSEISKLTGLTALWLHYNELRSLPSEISKLTGLTVLYLENNQLTSLPSEISKLTRLTELSLSDNQLTSVPPEMAELTGLTWLGLRGNPIASVTQDDARHNEDARAALIAVSGMAQLNRWTDWPAADRFVRCHKVFGRWSGFEAARAELEMRLPMELVLEVLLYLVNTDINGKNYWDYTPQTTAMDLALVLHARDKGA